LGERVSTNPENIEKRRRRRGNEIYAAIRKVLFWHWDPIGVRDCVKEEDEYDAYVGPVYRLLGSGASDQELAAYLTRTERETMGLNVPSGAQDLEEVIRLLRAIDIRGE
jgi:hypothetical protein